MSQRGERKGQVVMKPHREEKGIRDRMLVDLQRDPGETAPLKEPDQQPMKEEAIF